LIEIMDLPGTSQRDSMFDHSDEISRRVSFESVESGCSELDVGLVTMTRKRYSRNSVSA
jgi:hypothetical protein